MQRVSPEEGEEEIQGRHDMCVCGGGGRCSMCDFLCVGVCLHMFIHPHVLGERMKVSSSSFNMDRKEESLY